MLPLAPDMASLSVGSNNFPTRVYENPPDLVNWLASEMKKYRVTPEVEAFDLSHILTAIRMYDRNELYGNYMFSSLWELKMRCLLIKKFLIYM